MNFFLDGKDPFDGVKQQKGRSNNTVQREPRLGPQSRLRLYREGDKIVSVIGY